MTLWMSAIYSAVVLLAAVIIAPIMKQPLKLFMGVTAGTMTIFMGTVYLSTNGTPLWVFVLLFVVLFVFPSRWSFNRIKARPITDEEYKMLMKRNAIHYSHDMVNVADGEVVLKSFEPKIDYKANYSMQGDLKKLPYIWFHVSHEDFGTEPTKKSLVFNHMNKKKRNSKYILPFQALDKKNIFIREHDGAIAYQGELKNMEVAVYSNFPWISLKQVGSFWGGFFSPFQMLTIPYISFFRLQQIMDSRKQGKKLSDTLEN